VALANRVLLVDTRRPVSLSLRDCRIEIDMVQQPSSALDLSTQYDHRVVPFPTRCEPCVPIELPEPSAGCAATGRRVRLRTRAVRKVVVVEVAGRLDDAVEDLDRAIELALAEGPRGVVCDLSAVLEGAGPVAVEVLASAGRHVRDWPGIPVAVACPDPRVREALEVHPLGGQLIVTASLFSAVTAVLATPTPAVEWLRLARTRLRRAPRGSSSRAPCWTGGWAGLSPSQPWWSASSWPARQCMPAPTLTCLSSGTVEPCV